MKLLLLLIIITALFWVMANLRAPYPAVPAFIGLVLPGVPV